MRNAGLINYEFHLPPRQQRWADTYSKELQDATDICTEEAKKFRAFGALPRPRLGMIIDPPDQCLSPTHQWEEFLAEMHRAAARSNNLADGTEIKRWIGVAEAVPAERKK